MSAHVCLQVAKHRIQLVLVPGGGYVAAGGDVGLLLLLVVASSAEVVGLVPWLVVMGRPSGFGYVDSVVVALRSSTGRGQRTTGRDDGVAR